MAIRVPKNGGSQGDGTRTQGTTAPRPAGSPRTRISNNTRAPSGGRGRAPKRRPRKRNRRGKSGCAQRPQPATDPFLILFGWIACAAAAAWMVVAHAAGYAARALGRSVADLDLMHRR